MLTGRQMTKPTADRIISQVRALVLGVVLMALGGVAVRISASFSAAVPPAPVRAIFDPSTPDGGPFPSDAFTVADPRQLTGLRVNLPKPDCTQRPSDCEDITVLNTFDGFNMQPRLSIPFSGAIDVNSVTSRTIFLIRLGDARVIGINQIVWDTLTNILHASVDESLDEHTRYALVVTRGIRSASGTPIEAPIAFRRFRQTMRGPYRAALLDAIAAAARAGTREADIAVASVFTTQTFSHIVTRMRDAIQRAPAPKLEFTVGSDGTRAVFDAARIETLTTNADVTVGGPLTPQPMVQLLTAMRVIPGAVGTIAFGTFRTLDFTVHPYGHIAPIPTRTGTLTPTGSIDGAFDLWLPAGTPPPHGWPIVIYGPGSFGSKDTPFSHAGVLTSHGFAVIAINVIGRGRGPRTTMTVGLTGGASTTFAAPGLGEDANGDGTIEPWEPRRVRRPYAVLNTSGSIAQAVAQYFALVRAIQAGVDVNRDGTPDLDASRIYYLGQSLGAMWGMFVFAYEPAIRAAVFNVPVGTLIYNTSRSLERASLGALLDARVPSLLNAPQGITSIDGVALEAPYFNENLPLRNEAPRVNTMRGAMDIQQVLDRIAWAAQICSTVAIAPRLRRTPPPGVPARPFIVQWARSDQIATNPTASELIRAGDFADRVLFYRHDLNLKAAGIDRPVNPHGFLSMVAVPAPHMARVALGAQHQIGRFFESDGAVVIHPEPADVWEWPIRAPLPEDTYFLPRPR